jgi:hypothetical protein
VAGIVAWVVIWATWLPSITSANEPPFLAEGRAHWAFQPLKPVSSHQSGQGNQSGKANASDRPLITGSPIADYFSNNPIDAFVFARLAQQGLSPAPPADPRTLARRLYFDLIGLPPTPEEVEAFVRQFSPSDLPTFPPARGESGKVSKRESEQVAVAALVDKLLASPHYGERWGRHWLDVARFAETDGFEHDLTRPHAWRYRDYVIRAFNADKPYDRFIREQIAGDELFPDDPDALIATAFNLLGPDMVDSSDQVQRRLNTLNDMTDTAAAAFLGLTLGCARCHDHKFEPFSQRDYFRLQAYFTPATFRSDLPVPSREQRDAYEKAVRDYDARTKSQREELAALEAPHRQKVFEQKLAKLNSEAQEAHRTPPEQRTTDQANLVLETERLVQVTEKEFIKYMPTEDTARHKELKEQIAKVPKPPSVPLSQGLQAGKDASAKTYVLLRGDYNNRGDEVKPGLPAVMERGLASGWKRADLAGWIASPDNPLTARVIVNRVWLHHFGRGIVGTPSDFGLKGDPPTHLELLDWLAGEFIAQGWSLKKLHRLILTSATYQQSSHASEATLKADPNNQLFSRWSRLRLEGEVIRDSLLAVSGRLNPRMGGPGVFPPIPDDVFKGAKGWTVSTDEREHHRRSIYIFARRNLRFPFLEVFDAPDSNLSCSRRERSTTAPQSLTLLNADEVLAAARSLAARLEKEAADPAARVDLAYRLVLNRPPTAKEQALAVEFLAHAPTTELCRAMFNLNAFVYVD